MVRKKTEGNEEQRRAAARQARSEGEAPSALKETTGASKQRAHLPGREPREERLAARHAGKQDWQARRSGGGGGRRRGAHLSDQHRPSPDLGAVADFASRPGDYTRQHEQVFEALTVVQQAHGREAAYLDEIAEGSGMPATEVRGLLHDLAKVHRLVTQLHDSDSPDLGPRYEVKPRL